MLFLDLGYSSMCMYGLSIYVELKDEITTNFSQTTLVSIILPFLSILGIVMLGRFFATAFIFLIVPWWSVRDQRRIFMRLGGGLYANAKFPILKYRDYVLQLQRFSLHELNEFDQENQSSAKCKLCNKVTEMEDEVVVLPCNFQHFFMKACIQKWFSDQEVCPICRFEVFNHHNYLASSRDSIQSATPECGREKNENF